MHNTSFRILQGFKFGIDDRKYTWLSTLLAGRAAEQDTQPSAKAKDLPPFQLYKSVSTFKPDIENILK